MGKLTKETDCPCGSGEPFSVCCSPYLNRERAAPSPEALMRSRFSAYVLGQYEYIYSSWHPRTRPALDTLKPEPGIQWIRLKIITTTADSVEFKATYKRQGKACHLHERSRFQREQGQWYYVDGNMNPGQNAL